MRKNILLLISILLLSACSSHQKKIDRIEFAIVKNQLSQNVTKNIGDSVYLSQQDILKTTIRDDNSILLEISQDASDSLKQLTKKHIGEQLMTLIDGKINSTATIQGSIDTRFIVIALSPDIKNQYEF
ncbi:hypothetical protein IHC93_16115 [Photobacterium damselae subsp. damselae]|uniref:hypothetical protein n=1 Tax=Photobacterium damselae TaxID=38293 RepID=UPI001245C64E|nr:hypothetical protein [Photobacterium damselae]KAB1181756.1 hypothetical protein F6477_04245 [Photobacterium damselae subsp. damselae]MBF7100470.1 hypothetical protein [Photobacterium damselae]UKA27548.1 hypothetical protein IHC93_16115 [Photobacterium damselae subsp. damselae]